VASTAAETVIELSGPVDLGAVLAPLRPGGAADPCLRRTGNAWWRATPTPSGPATVQLRPKGTSRVAVRAWGPGAGDAVDDAPTLLGAHDDGAALWVSGNDTVRALARRRPGLRLCASRAVFAALVAAVLGQKVQGRRAA